MPITKELFSFKQKSQDFIVEEKLPFELSGKGDALFIYFEKRNLNTMDVVDHLTKSLKISRMALGIAGLKDKKAITRQWISVYKSILKKVGGQQVFESCLSEKVKILKSIWHIEPIGMTTQIENVFHIRLRANKKLSQKEKALVTQKLEYLFDNGFPNLYGDQRFGVDERNWKQGKAILSGELNITKKSEAVFKLQAYASKMFNEYLISRAKNGLTLINGDIVNILDNGKTGIYLADIDKLALFKDDLKEAKKKGKLYRYISDLSRKIDVNGLELIPTGPVIGYNLLLTAKQTESGQKEKSFLDARKINDRSFQVFKDYKIYGIRRALWVYPNDVNMRFQDDDLLISFSLPSGAYASVLIDEMMDRI